MSTVKDNAEKDSYYKPYCMRCPGARRMSAVVQPFYWRCNCGAEHDERGDALESKYTYTTKWSLADVEHQYCGYVAEFPSLSFFANDRTAAMYGIMKLVRDILVDMQTTGETPPEPVPFTGTINT